MNWFKKVVKQILKDNQNEMDQVESFTEEHKPNVSNDRKKEMDSKVIYQYPKGKFRFPVIPDNEKQEARREKKQREYTIEPNKEIYRASKQLNQSNLVQTKQDKEENQQYTAPQESVTKAKKPFRLTETPSPIYGYNRPVKKENKELDLHIKNIVSTTEDRQIEKIDKTKREENLLLFDERTSEGLEMEDRVSLNQQEENKPYEADADDEQKNLEWTAADYQEEWKAAEGIQDTFFIEETELLQDAVESQKESASIIEENQKETAAVVEENQKEISALEDVSEEICKQEQIEVEIIGDGEQEYPLETKDKVHSSHNEEEESDPIGEESKPKQASSKRGPLPFNVLMLNKDRQYIKKKSEQSKETSLEQKAPIAENKIAEKEEKDIPYYAFPSMDLLQPPILDVENADWIQEQKKVLNVTLTNFNVQAKVVNVTQGPSVTRYEVQPEPGVKVSKITNLSDDLKLSLAAKDIRIEAPIPGKHTIGIEVPNHSSRPVLISEIIKSEEFKESASPLTVALGLDISGKPIVTDLRKMPHGLIAGATGSGKSVCINTMLVSLLYKSKPEELKLLLIDPKMVELAPFNHIPHLASPVITDVKAATAALKWAVEEMERRYELLAHSGVRDITKFNQLAEDHKRYANKLPYIVIVIDELADLMMMAPADVEEAISRIAQKARACGIHLLIATQRPSVDVITGLIKANVPTRIAFSVSSQIDSRTVIDISGAEKLLGKGDMLFLENGTSKPVRLQGTFVSDEEIDDVVHHVRNEQKPEFLFEQEELLKKVQMTEEEDELFYEACEFIIEQGGASTSSLQRRFKIGYNRAARLIDMMEKQAFISEAKGTKPRDVLITEVELIHFQENA
ncbi:MAG: DNA translocase FtsK [Bacillus sp. (in: firmicutes)]